MNKMRFSSPSGSFRQSQDTMGLAMSSIKSSRNGASAIANILSTHGV